MGQSDVELEHFEDAVIHLTKGYSINFLHFSLDFLMRH